MLYCKDCYLKKLILKGKKNINKGEDNFCECNLVFHERCKDYVRRASKNPMDFIHKLCSESEIAFLMEAAEKIGHLSSPRALAYFLETDIKKVIAAVKEGKLPALKNNEQYYIKTLEILPHIDKINL